MSIKFVLEIMDATTTIWQVSKEEMVKQNRLASKLSHANCSSVEMASDLLIEGGCCSLHKKEHHYTLRPKDTTKSKPLIKMKKIICFPNCWLEDECLFKERELCVPNSKLQDQKIRPCKILQKLNDNAYKVKLPSHVQTSKSFNIQHLVPYVHGETSKA